MRSSSPSAIDLAHYHWLVSAAAEPYFARAEPISDPLARAKALRCDLTAERAQLVLEQIGLRKRAAKKFADAARLFFTPLGLEQATDQWIAAYKATRFPAARPVTDICCGIGGDLLALAARGPTSAVDRDPVSLLLAEVNLDRVFDPHRTPNRAPRSWPASFFAGEASTCHFDAGDVWHVDPDRRPAGRRTTRAELHNPPPELIDAWLEQAPAGAIKLAPGAELPAAWTAAAELEWISFARECRQLVAWFGELASQPGRKRATLVDREQGAVRTVLELPDAEVALAAQIGRYIFEPDAAVLAGGLAASLAAEHALQFAIPGGGYLTGEQAVDDRALQAFLVREVLAYDERRLRAALRERKIGKLEVKKRGVPHDPQAVERALKVPGDATATLLLTRKGKAVVAILAERISRP